jgi:pimeloyl-ACP methyl ester carboxylesterase
MFNPNLDYEIRLVDSDLAQINAKTLIIHGDRDALIPLEKATDMHQFIPNSSLWIVPNGGHVPISDKNLNMFNSVVSEFLKQK